MRLAEKGFDVVAAVEIYGQVQTLKRQADERGVTLQVEKLDVTEDREARQQVEALGYTSAPVVVAGDDHWSGFRPDRINALVA